MFAAHIHSLLGNNEAALFNAQKTVEAGFKAHWFNYPWTKFVYNKLIK